MIPYHDTLDISRIEMNSDSMPTIVFVTVPPFTHSVLYERVTARNMSIVEIFVSGPTKDTPRYHGCIKFKVSVNQHTLPWVDVSQTPSDEDLHLLLEFTTPMGGVEDVAILFPKIKCSVDIFDECRLYFTADSNTIHAQGRKFHNNIPVTDVAQKC